MPLNTVTQGGASIPAGSIMYPASVKGIWTTIHKNLSATASTAANLAKPYNMADTNAVLVEVHDGATRAIIRGKAAVALSAVATSPVIQVYGMYTNTRGLKTGDALPPDATFERVDITDPAAANAAGLTLTFAASSGNAALQDATFNYSQKTAAIDVKGAAYLLVLVATASSMTNGGTPTAEVCLLN